MVFTLLAEGFEEIEALAVVDILRRSEIDVCTVSLGKTAQVTGAHGIIVTADFVIDQIDDNYDLLFLPGGYPGYVNMEENTKAIELIKTAHRENKLIAAICAAPSILGKLGILNGKDACCFPGFEKCLTGANVLFEKVCTSGNVITSRGAGTSHELGFKIVELFKGKDVAASLRTAMLYE